MILLCRVLNVGAAEARPALVAAQVVVDRELQILACAVGLPPVSPVVAVGVWGGGEGGRAVRSLSCLC